MGNPHPKKLEWQGDMLGWEVDAVFDLLDDGRHALVMAMSDPDDGYAYNFHAVVPLPW
jgi:hypothetical protein